MLPKDDRVIEICRSVLNALMQFLDFLNYIYIYTRRRSNTTAFQLCFRVRYWEGSGKTGWLETKWFTSASGLCR